MPVIGRRQLSALRMESLIYRLVSRDERSRVHGRGLKSRDGGRGSFSMGFFVGQLRGYGEEDGCVYNGLDGQV
jgi:hypothetical protein